TESRRAELRNRRFCVPSGANIPEGSTSLGRIREVQLAPEGSEVADGLGAPGLFFGRPREAPSEIAVVGVGHPASVRSQRCNGGLAGDARDTNALGRISGTRLVLPGQVKRPVRTELAAVTDDRVAIAQRERVVPDHVEACRLRSRLEDIGSGDGRAHELAI